MVFDAFRVTVSLVVGAAVLWVVLGVSTGVVAARTGGTLIARAAMLTALAGVSLPSFFTAMLARLVFRTPLHGGDASYVPITESVGGWFGGLLLPWVTLA
ncbi:ABC transporter permease, partial [Streptomyces sp. SP18ES09]|nr:ABC transporter permease [Streptomyces sp. SP18ES09]